MQLTVSLGKNALHAAAWPRCGTSTSLRPGMPYSQRPSPAFTTDQRTVNPDSEALQNLVASVTASWAPPSNLPTRCTPAAEFPVGLRRCNLHNRTIRATQAMSTRGRNMRSALPFLWPTAPESPQDPGARTRCGSARSHRCIICVCGAAGRVPLASCARARLFWPRRRRSQRRLESQPIRHQRPHPRPPALDFPLGLSLSWSK